MKAVKAVDAVEFSVNPKPIRGPRGHFAGRTPRRWHVSCITDDSPSRRFVYPISFAQRHDARRLAIRVHGAPINPSLWKEVPR